jgi:hypothetical protein
MLQACFSARDVKAKNCVVITSNGGGLHICDYCRSLVFIAEYNVIDISASSFICPQCDEQNVCLVKKKRQNKQPLEKDLIRADDPDPDPTLTMRIRDELMRWNKNIVSITMRYIGEDRIDQYIAYVGLRKKDGFPKEITSNVYGKTVKEIREIVGDITPDESAAVKTPTHVTIEVSDPKEEPPRYVIDKGGFATYLRSPYEGETANITISSTSGVKGINIV